MATAKKVEQDTAGKLSKVWQGGDTVRSSELRWRKLVAVYKQCVDTQASLYLSFVKQPTSIWT